MPENLRLLLITSGCWRALRSEDISVRLHLNLHDGIHRWPSVRTGQPAPLERFTTPASDFTTSQPPDYAEDPFHCARWTPLRCCLRSVLLTPVPPINGIRAGYVVSLCCWRQRELFNWNILPSGRRWRRQQSRNNRWVAVDGPHQSWKPDVCPFIESPQR